MKNEAFVIEIGCGVKYVSHSSPQKMKIGYSGTARGNAQKERDITST